jgi:hypothetical protein
VQRLKSGIHKSIVALTNEDIQRIETNSRELERLRNSIKEKKPDTFYDKISDERKKEIID